MLVKLNSRYGCDKILSAFFISDDPVLLSGEVINGNKLYKYINI